VIVITLILVISATMFNDENSVWQNYSSNTFRLFSDVSLVIFTSQFQEQVRIL